MTLLFSKPLPTKYLLKQRHSCKEEKRKKTQESMTLTFSIRTACPSLSLCISFLTSVSQDPRVHDVLCFAACAFPWLSPTGQTKTGEPALWKATSPEHLQDLNSPKLLLYSSVLCTWGLLWIQSYCMSCLTIWTASPGIKLVSPHSLKCNVSMKKYYTGRAVLYYDGNFCFQLRYHSENMQLVTHPADTVKECGSEKKIQFERVAHSNEDRRKSMVPPPPQIIRSLDSLLP